MIKSLSPAKITVMINAVNFGGTLFGILLINKYGRKTLMVVFYLCIAVCLAGLGACMKAAGDTKEVGIY